MECLHRVNRGLVPQDAAPTSDFDFDNSDDEMACFPITLPDLITLWKSNRILNI
jgi:hypothetical protein